jgi:putative ABC transport system permease protein
MLSDLRFAVRSLLRNPGLTVVAVLSLALAVAGNAVVFSLVNGILLRPFDYQDPDTLVFLWQTNPNENLGQTPVAPANFVDFRERAESFAAVVAFRPNAYSLLGDGEPESLLAGMVTPDFFPTLGKNLAYGRHFTAEEGLEGNHRVAILTYNFWEQRFGADPTLVGRSIDLSGERYQVVGILPEGFDFVFNGIQVWVPYGVPPEPSRTYRVLTVMARLKPGVTAQQADQEMQLLAEQLEREHPEANRGYSAQAITMKDQLPGESNVLLLWLMQGSLVFVLLIASVNVANLLLARGQTRGKELALRATLGATRGRLLRQLLTEGALLAVLGAVGGVGLGALGIEGLRRAIAGQVPENFMPRMEPAVLLFTLAVTTVAALVFAVVPAVQASRPQLGGTLREAGPGSTPAGGRRLLSRALVVVEIVLAVVLLSGAGMLVRSFLEMQRADPGFDPENLLTLRLTLPQGQYPEDAEKIALYQRLRRDLAAIPGVESATLASRLPRSFVQTTINYTVDGREMGEEAQPSAIWLAVSPQYLETLGIPLVEGRTFRPADDAAAPPVVLINRTLAERLWPGVSPLGERLTVFGASREIVGVSADVLQELNPDPRRPKSAILYLPQAQHTVPANYLVLRTAADPQPLKAPVRGAILRTDPKLTISRLWTLEEHVANYFAGTHVVSQLLTAFGFLALFLAAIGVYGVIAYAVSRRTREIGVRRALGAGRGHIVRRVVLEGLILAVLSCVVAIPGIFGVIRLVESVLAGLGTVQPSTAVVVAAVLIVVAVLASLLPARRAAGLDPLRALREE